jgi:undecaprenyl-diphosphatase
MRNEDTDAVFTPAEGTLARRIGTRMRNHRPIVTGLAVWLAAIVALAAVMVGIGLLLTTVLLPAGVGRFDGNVGSWFVGQRTPSLTTASTIGSDIGSTVVVLGVAAIAVVVLAVGRHWRQIGFLVCAMTVEFTVFLTATLFVDRRRPNVPRLDATPPTSSYPSGHTAASIALYVGLAIVIWSLVRSTAVRTVIWVLAVAVPIFVGLSRLYRGMHHLTDVLGSVVLGCAALVVALLATRSAVAASEARAAEPVPLVRSETSLGMAS